ncbi:hypothetical protein C0989_004956 [Termitomyces sp. Mn162]|nr:hypothetical protein C0989_004956 [Termitomyces sp. Mn162]
MFQAKPITFQLESSQVTFTALYLQGIAFNHYMALLQFDPNNPILSNRLAFTQEFSSKFSIFDTVAEQKHGTRTLWNTSGNTNWQARAANSIQSLIPANPAPHFPLGQGISNANQPLEQRLPAQLNTADLHETPEPLNANPNDHNDIPDSVNH